MNQTSHQQFKSVLDDVGLKYTNDQFNGFVVLFDKDGDGKISYNEVQAVFEKYDSKHSLKSNLMGLFDAGKSKVLGSLLSLDINITEKDYF